MTIRLPKSTAALGFIAVLASVGRISAAQTAWSTLAPTGEGFSIDVPGESKPTGRPGYYIYNADEWAYFVKVDPISDTIRELVVAADRGPITQYLDTIRKGMLKKLTERSSSAADFNGFPSVRFSADGESDDKQTFQGKYWFVVTDEHYYTLMAFGPRGASTANADRFLGSFRLDKAAALPGATASATPSPKGPLAARLTTPMLAVALLITEERLSPLIDQMLTNSPAAARGGSRWNSTSPAWQKVRASMVSRIRRIAALYEETGEMERTFDAALAKIAPGSQADVVAMLNGPAGPALVREHASISFVTAIMSDDPNGPTVGGREWNVLVGKHTSTFDERLGSIMPRDKSLEAEVEKIFSTPAGDVLRLLWYSVVSKATTQIKGAANLALFDERDAINREIAAAIASLK